MSDAKSSMAGRELGALPLSVGTSIPFETLKATPNLHYLHIYVNLQTLFRNLHGALPSLVVADMPLPIWVGAMTEEIQMIVMVCREVSEKMKVHFYCPTYATLAKEMPKAILRGANTNNQIAYAAIQEEVLMRGMKQAVPWLVSKGVDIQYTENGPKQVHPHALILTHLPVDLLKAEWGSRLLESHTGKIKDRSLWYTKFTGKADHSKIPFNKLTLTVLGDSTNIAPQSRQARAALLKLADEKKWTPVTTYDYVRFSVDHMRDYGLRDLFRSMF